MGYVVFAYTPDKKPRADDIPTRGAATFRGETVAVADGSPGTTAATVPKLYARKIELVASFSMQQVTGTISELKDEDGRAFEAMSSDSFRKETVESIALPAGDASDDGEGFYEAEPADVATVSFAHNLCSESTTTSVFKVQLVDEVSEVLGIWTGTDTDQTLKVEGSFDATRSGSVTTPSLPRLTADSGKVIADTRAVLTCR